MSNKNLPPLLNFDNFTFRASSVNKIMGELGFSKAEEYLECIADIQKFTELNAKAKDTTTDTYINRSIKISKLIERKNELEPFKDDRTPSLPQTAITYLLEVYVCVRDGIKIDIHSKYFDKGIACEDESIEMLGELHDRPYAKCTLPRHYNKFIEGELDVRYIEESENLRLVIDMKNSWDAITFEKRINKIIDEGYEDQGQCYLELYDCEEFMLVFALMNMPDGLIKDEEKRILYQYGTDMDGSAEYNKSCAEFRKKCNFDHLPLRERFFEFNVNRNRERYNEIVNRIILCRTWLNEYAKQRYLYVHGVLPSFDNLKDASGRDANPIVAVFENEIIPLSGSINSNSIKSSFIPKPIFIESGKPEMVIVSSEFEAEIILGKFDSAKFDPKYFDTELNGKTSTKVVDIKFNEKNEANVTLEFTEGDIVSENSFEGGNDINELENIKVRIVSCQSEDQLRSYRNEIKDAGLLVKYTELNDIFIKKKQSFNIPQSEESSPIKEEKKTAKRQLPTEVKEKSPKQTAIQEPQKTITETKSPETLSKISEISEHSKTFKTLKELQTYTKQNSEFIIKNKELCLELTKFALTLPLE